MPPPSPAKSSRAVAGPLQKAGLILFGLVVAALLLVASEGVLALFDLGGEARREDPFVGFEPGRELFVRRAGSDGAEIYVTSPEKLAFFNLQEFPVRKGEGAFRIFALGGSTTFGRPYDAAAAFPKWLEIYLEAVAPERTWEVVNAGGVSYASYRLVVLMRELLRYEPDLFVVYTGHNEFLEERTYSDILDLPPALRRLRLWLGRLRTYALVRRGWQGLAGEEEGEKSSESRLASEVAATLDGWAGIDDYRRSEDFKRRTVEHFSYNVRRLVTLARRGGADVLFVEPVSNLKDFSPFKSENRAGLTVEERARFAGLLDAGRQLLERERPRSAAEELERAAALDSEHAELHFLLGRALFALGEIDRARDAFVRAKDLDVAPLRATEPLLEALRSVVREEGVTLIGLPALLEAEMLAEHGHPILGNELLLDHVHPDVPVHSQLAVELLEVLRRRGVVSPERRLSAEQRERLYAERLETFDAGYYAVRDLNLAKVLGWAGKLREAEGPLLRAAAALPDDAEVHLNLGTLYQRTGRFAAAAEELELAARLAPRVPETHFNLGVVRAANGELGGAVRAFEEAIRLRDDYAEATYNLGVVLRRLDRLDEALATLRRAAELRGESPEITSQIGTVLRLQGRLEEALAAFARALSERPGDVGTLVEQGITLAELGRLEEARSTLERALTLDPDEPEALFNLGRVLSRQEIFDEAIEAYIRALEVEPRMVRAYNNLGILYGRRGRLEAARKVLQAALEIDPEYAEAHLNLSVVQDAAGHRQESLRSVERAVELEPENGRFHLAYAMLLAASGESRAALRHFELARSYGAEVEEATLRRLREAVGEPR